MNKIKKIFNYIFKPNRIEPLALFSEEEINEEEDGANVNENEINEEEMEETNTLVNTVAATHIVEKFYIKLKSGRKIMPRKNMHFCFCARRNQKINIKQTYFNFFENTTEVWKFMADRDFQYIHLTKKYGSINREDLVGIIPYDSIESILSTSILDYTLSKDEIENQEEKTESTENTQ